MARKKGKRRTRTDAPLPRDRAGTPAWFDAWAAAPSAVRHVICLVFLLAVAVVFMAPAIFSEGSLIGSDIVQWRATAEGLLEAERQTGHRPLWAAHTFAGMPAYMISYKLAIPQLDEIGRLLRLAIWPLSHLLILFAGMYGLVYTLSRHEWASVVAAIGFGLTTYLPILLIAGHNSKYVALAFLPWLLWAFVHVLRRPTMLGGMLFAAALALNLRAGHIQITYYGAFFIGIYWLIEAVGAVREGRLRTFALSTAWLAAGGVLGLLMVAQPYLVQEEFKRYTIRGMAAGGAAGGLGWSAAMAWSQAPAELLTFLVPDAFGGGGATYWGPKTFTAGPHYLGPVVLMLAVVALWRSRRRSVIALAATATVMTLFSLGEYLPVLNRFMYNYFPLFEAFRVPETWLSVVSLVIAVLAGMGIAELRQGATPRNGNRSTDVAVLGAAGIVVGATLVLFLFGTSLLSFQRTDEARMITSQVIQQRPDLSPTDPQVLRFVETEIATRSEDRIEGFSTDARRSLLFALAAAALLLLVRRRALPIWVVAVLLAMLAAFDLGDVGRRYLNQDAMSPVDAAQELVPTYAFDQYMIDKRKEAGGFGRFRVLSLEGDPLRTARPSFHHESLGGYNGARLRRYQDYLDSILFDASSGRPNVNALRIANVRYVAAGGALPGMEAVFVDEATGFAVFEVPEPRPRAWLVDRVEMIPEAEAQWARIGDEDFDPATTVILESDPELAVPTGLAEADSTGGPGIGNVEMLAWSADAATWRVETELDRMLVVSEVFYPAGWIATIDGQPAEIVPANYTFRAVRIPAGEHEVRLAFEPERHRIGVIVSGGATAFVYGSILILLGFFWRSRKREGSVPESPIGRGESTG